MIYGNMELYNVSEVLSPDDGLGKIITRIPNKLRQTLNPNARIRALCAAGCEIRFNLKGDTAKITLSCDEPAIAEVFQGSFQVSWHVVGGEPTEIIVSTPENIDLLDEVTREKNLPFDAHLTRVMLPYRPGVRIIDVEGDASPPKRDQTPQTKYLAYGSSITHGSRSIRPTGSYAMRVAQILGVDLINLDFGGGAHCEKQIADYIAKKEDWSFATMEMGINMVIGFSTKEFKKRAEYLIERVAKAHTDKWVFCIDMFTFAADFNPTAKKQNEFRRIIRNTVKTLDTPKLVYVDGRTILKDVPGLTFDLVHPAASGMEEIASNLSSLIKDKMNQTKN